MQVQNKLARVEKNIEGNKKAMSEYKKKVFFCFLTKCNKVVQGSKKS